MDTPGLGGAAGSVQTEQGSSWLESEHADEAWFSFVPCLQMLQPSSPSPIPMAISSSLEGSSGWPWCPGIVDVSITLKRYSRNTGIFLLGKQML